MDAIVLLLPLLLLLMIVTPTAVAHGENKLAPDPNKSAPYNTGFSQGYVGIPLKGHHTHNFLAGYINGTALYWFNRGDTEGYNACELYRLPELC